MLLKGKRFVRQFLPSRWGEHGRLKSEHQIVSGVPDGITFDALNRICLKYQHEPLTRAAYAHISGWKSSGAFLLWLHLHNGREWRVVYKNAIYLPNHIPAVIGLPVMPGPPEYTVCSRGSGPFAEYLPAVYLSEEITPGKHYHYVMEDVSTGFHPLSYKSPQVVDVAGDLPTMHRTMQEWANFPGENRLLRFGAAFAAGLVEYAQTNLERYACVDASPTVSKVNADWAAIIEIYQQPEFLARQILRPIHGDYSPANIYLSRQKPTRLKILDWEWAGYGVPHADLAALLKRTTPEIEQQALVRYSERDRTLSPTEHRRMYEWCQLERGILDAAYLAKQHLDAPTHSSSIPAYIERSLRRVLQAIERLS